MASQEGFDFPPNLNLIASNRSDARIKVMTTGELKFQTPWRNIQGCECRITSTDWKHYSFHVGNPYNISVDGFTSSVAANIAMRLRVTALKALPSTEEETNHQPDNLIEIGKRGKKRGKKPEPVEPVKDRVEDVVAVAAVIPIESKRKGRPPKSEYTFTAAEDAELVPAVETEDW